MPVDRRMYTEDQRMPYCGSMAWIIHCQIIAIIMDGNGRWLGIHQITEIPELVRFGLPPLKRKIVIDYKLLPTILWIVMYMPWQEASMPLSFYINTQTTEMNRFGIYVALQRGVLETCQDRCPIRDTSIHPRTFTASVSPIYGIASNKRDALGGMRWRGGRTVDFHAANPCLNSRESILYKSFWSPEYPSSRVRVGGTICLQQSVSRKAQNLLFIL